MGKQKGITLIALIVTIIVLIILAGISINLILGENGIITQAQRARELQANAEAHEKDVMDGLVEQVGIETGEIIVNPYDPDGWVYAWTCTDGVWSDKIEAGNPAEGDIAAKIYETGNKIIPPPLDIGDDREMLLEEGNEYVMVIEGQGEMGALIEVSDENEGPCAWFIETFAFIMGESDTCTIPYVSKAIICDGVNNIGSYACFGGMNLKKIVIANSVTSIGDFAFDSCSSLTNVTIPNSVTSIGDYAFYNCSSLTNVKIPNSVTSIGNRAFSGCSSLTNVTIPNSVTSIGNYAFDDCSSLTNVTIGNGVTSIGDYAFHNCSSLTNVTIGNSVTSIGDFAFDSCSSLTNVTIPNSVTSIGDYAFWGCNKLSKIKINNTNYETIEFGSDIFWYIAEESVIYVLNEEMKSKLEGIYNTARTKVQVVTQAEMDAI